MVWKAALVVETSSGYLLGEKAPQTSRTEFSQICVGSQRNRLKLAGLNDNEVKVF